MTETHNIDTPDYYEIYSDELQKNDIYFHNPIQLHAKNAFSFETTAELSMDPYTQNNSMIMGYTSEPFVEFKDGKPYKYTIYRMTIAVATSKIFNKYSGLIEIDETGTVIYDKCIFHVNFFKVHPCFVKSYKCEDPDKCDPEINLSKERWCSRCHGEFMKISNLVKLVIPKIGFTSMPQASIVYIDKTVKFVDLDDVECLRNLDYFFRKDARIIVDLRNKIFAADQRLKWITDQILGGKELDQKILDNILSTRGGSFDAYKDLVKEFEEVFTKKGIK